MLSFAAKVNCIVHIPFPGPKLLVRRAFLAIIWHEARHDHVTCMAVHAGQYIFTCLQLICYFVSYPGQGDHDHDAHDAHDAHASKQIMQYPKYFHAPNETIHRVGENEMGRMSTQIETNTRHLVFVFVNSRLRSRPSLPWFGLHNFTQDMRETVVIMVMAWRELSHNDSCQPLSKLYHIGLWLYIHQCSSLLP
jgi:hypothetical protein